MKENQFYLEIEELKIYTRSIGESSKAIVFIHGNSLSSGVWDMQFADHQLHNNYRLIAIDLPGHGKSSHSENPQYDYSLSGMANIIARVVEKLNLENFVMAGLSLGTNVIADSILFFKNNRCKGILLAAACIGNTDVPPNLVLIASPYLHVAGAGTCTEEDLTGFLNTVTENDQLLEHYKYTFKNTDPQFRPALTQSIMNGEWMHEIDNIRESNLPVCIVMGAEDKLVHRNYLDNVDLKKWKDQVFKIIGAGHIVNFEKADMFNKILLDFAGDCLNK